MTDFASAATLGGTDRTTMAGTSYKGSEIKDVNQFLKDKAGADVEPRRGDRRASAIATMNLVTNHKRITPFARAHGIHGLEDLNWRRDVHMGYEEGEPAIFDRNVNGWVRIPSGLELPDNQQDRDMMARELLIKFQMSPKHPMVQAQQGAYRWGF